MPAEACFWKKRWAADAVRRAHQAERPVDDEGLHARPDQRVVVEQILLGDAGSPATAACRGCVSFTDGLRGSCRAGSRLPPAVPSAFALLRPCRSACFGFSCNDFLRPACPRAGPGTRPGAVYGRMVQTAELDLGDQFRLDPDQSLSFAHRRRRKARLLPSARRAASSDPRPTLPVKPVPTRPA